MITADEYKKSAKIKGIAAGVVTWFAIGPIGNILIFLLEKYVADKTLDIYFKYAYKMA